MLEAWSGRSASAAMTAARGMIDLDGPPLKSTSKVDPDEEREQQSVLAEGVTLVLLILSVAAWATPIRRQLGPGVLSHAILVALPIAIALQWRLRSRYLSRRHGLSSLARDGWACCGLLLLLIEVPLALIPSWGPMAAILVPVWVGGTVLTRRGWGLDVRRGARRGDDRARQRPAGLRRSRHADSGHRRAVSGGGRSPAAEPPTNDRARFGARCPPRCWVPASAFCWSPTRSLGWGVHGIHPAIALIPSVVGSIWGGYYMWNFYDEIPRGLRGVPLDSASRAALSDPAMSIFIGAIARWLAPRSSSPPW